jgi:xanthine dehydrogenase accessory factor
MDCLRAAIKKPNAYIGMMGSKKRVALVKEQLTGEGIPAELLVQVHTPIGLPIGSETPEEIAVSIMAEIIREKNAKKRISSYEKELLACLTGENRTGQNSVLCTIVAKKGSAPREIGTKMLILEDGTTVGTIGGGCAESSIIQIGLHMLREGTCEPRLELVDMTGREAEELGMVCGGTIQVFMEYMGKADGGKE